MPITSTTTTRPRIYAACLASYAAGRLHGVWIDAAQPAEDIRAAIDAMLAASPVAGAEEHAIHDHEGFLGARVGEHEDLDNLSALTSAIATHGELLAGLLDHVDDLDDALDALENRYQGAFDSLSDWAASYIDDVMDVPTALAGYLDYSAWARDAVLSGDVFAVEAEGKTHVFTSV